MTAELPKTKDSYLLLLLAIVASRPLNHPHYGLHIVSNSGLVRGRDIMGRGLPGDAH